jgi:LPXTG-motif cell wall-anchored protein
MNRAFTISSFSVLLLTLLGSLIPSLASGQISATARLDTHTIRIGEQPTLTLSLQYREKSGRTEVVFPRIEKALSEHVETIERSTVDTLVPQQEKAPELRRLTQRIRITSFDSGQHRIPPFHFQVNGDSISTDPILLRVGSVDLSQRKDPYPIKGIEPIPYPWSAWFKDHWPWFAIAGGGLLIALGLFLFYRYRKRKSKEGPAPPPRPSHELALERFERLREEKAFQEWDPKTYYSELTHILRDYLEARYRIPALEETTPKILNELSFTDIHDEGKGRVRKILRTADMVKFAKQRPEAGERERTLEEAMAFVQRSALPDTGTENEGSAG